VQEVNPDTFAPFCGEMTGGNSLVGPLDFCTFEGVSGASATASDHTAVPTGGCLLDSDCSTGTFCDQTVPPTSLQPPITCQNGNEVMGSLGTCVSFCTLAKTQVQLEIANQGVTDCSSSGTCSGDYTCSAAPAGLSVFTCDNTAYSLTPSTVTNYCTPNTYAPTSAYYDDITASTIIMTLPSLPHNENGPCETLFDATTCTALGTNSNWQTYTDDQGVPQPQVIITLGANPTLAYDGTGVLTLISAATPRTTLLDLISDTVYDNPASGSITVAAPASTVYPQAMVLAPPILSAPCSGVTASEKTFDGSQSYDFSGRNSLTYAWAVDTNPGSSTYFDTLLAATTTDTVTIPSADQTTAWYTTNAGSWAFKLTVTNVFGGTDTYTFNVDITTTTTPVVSTRESM
jgi:hypothetical protein